MIHKEVNIHYWNINVCLFLICLVDKARAELEQVPKVRTEYNAVV